MANPSDLQRVGPQANLSGADLSNADLRQANLSGANLNGASLFEATLEGANLRNANLQFANMSGANLRQADLRDADLWGAKLDEVLHEGWSRQVDLGEAKYNEGTRWPQGIDPVFMGAHLMTSAPSSLPGMAFMQAISAHSWQTRFFEGGFERPDVSQIRHSIQFQGANTRYIYWELYIEHPWDTPPRALQVDAVWLRSDGSQLATQNVQGNLMANSDNSAFALGFGNETPGAFWQPGDYTVLVLVNGEQVSQGTFSVF